MSQNELKTYKKLRKSSKHSKGPITPEVFFLGNYQGTWMIIMERQGPNLLEVLQAQTFNLSLESICVLGIKLVCIILYRGYTD